jgi:hypothetical protein
VRKDRRAVSLFAYLFIFLSSSLAVGGIKWLGTWSLNIAASKFTPGPAPKSETLKFESAELGIKLTSHIVDAQGKATKGDYVSEFDGKDVRWKGNPDADTSSARRIDNNSYENEWEKAGKVVVNEKVVVSPDGKTLTVTETGTNSKGEAVDNTLVFDRQ